MKAKPAVPSKTNQVTGDRAAADRHFADQAVGSVASNAMVMHSFAKRTIRSLDFVQCLVAMNASVSAVKTGGVASAESMLLSQAVALNAIFGELAMLAAANIGKSPDGFDTYMRHALKAQGQARATLETMAAINNRPVVFARQANIAHGPQQVNNGSHPIAQSAAPVSLAPEVISAEALAPSGRPEAALNRRLAHGKKS